MILIADRHAGHGVHLTLTTRRRKRRNIDQRSYLLRLGRRADRARRPRSLLPISEAAVAGLTEQVDQREERLSHARLGDVVTLGRLIEDEHGIQAARTIPFSAGVV